jgi:hypothetical protein
MRHRRPAAVLPAAFALLLSFACAAAAPALAAPSLSWSGAVEVDSGHALRAISCPTAELCVAVDSAGRAVIGTRAGAATADSWAWSASFAIDGAGEPTSISCASAALCVAVDRKGNAMLSTDPASAGPGSWSKSPIVGAGELTSVSCASTALCVAVDGEGHVFSSTKPASAGSGAWSAPASIAKALAAVSCASTALCVAVDGAGNALLSTEPSGGASAWHGRPIDPGLGLVAVSCFASDSCVAVDGTAQTALASSNAAAATGAGPGSGATWSSTAFDTEGAPLAVSCASSGLCVAVDGTGYALASDDSTAAPPSWPASGIDTPRALAGVSCTAEGLCAAVDTSGRVFTAEVPAPTATSDPAVEVAHTSAILTGTVDANDAATTCRFEYGTSTAYGSIAPCAGVPSGSAPAAVSATLTSLAANTTYYYRLVASSAVGSAEGGQQTFKTLAPGLVEPHPSIGGTPAPGQRLTCKSGVTATSGVTLTYAWLRNNAAIAGATGSTYTVTGADVSHHLQCRVTATTAEGSKSATSAYVTVPAGGLGTVSETTVGTPRAGRDAVSVPLTCSAQAAGGCTIKLSLTVQETLSGSRVVAVAARRVTVTVGTHTVRLKPSQQSTATVALNANGKRLLARMRKLAVRCSVSGTVVGAISASLKSATVTLKAPARASAHKASARRRR